MSGRMTAEEIARVRAPLDQSWTLPPAAYTDPTVFAAEVEHIFRREWLCVARLDQLPNPGDYRCVDLIDQPIVVVRDRAGEIHALSRVCLHRAMPVAEGHGNASRFVCPYHNWTYELDGRLRSAPLMDGLKGFAPDACRLPSLRVEVWQGFVFVNLDPQCPPLAPRLTGLEPLLGNYGLSELVIASTATFDSPWNWKILVENFMEAYHHTGVHRHTLERSYPGRDAFVDGSGDTAWSLLRMPGRAGHAEDGGLPTLPGLTAEQRRELIAGCVFPCWLFAASADMVVWYEALPVAHDRLSLRIHVLLRREVAAALDDASRAAVAGGVRAIHLEDIPANQGPWRGLQAPLTAQGRLSRHEAAIWHQNQRWLDRMPASSAGDLPITGQA